MWQNITHRERTFAIVYFRHRPFVSPLTSQAWVGVHWATPLNLYYCFPCTDDASFQSNKTPEVCTRLSHTVIVPSVLLHTSKNQLCDSVHFFTFPFITDFVTFYHLKIWLTSLSKPKFLHNFSLETLLLFLSPLSHLSSFFNRFRKFWSSKIKNSVTYYINSLESFSISLSTITFHHFCRLSCISFPGHQMFQLIFFLNIPRTLLLLP